MTHPTGPLVVSLIERKPATVACRRYVGPPGEAIGRFWIEEIAPWLVAAELLGRARYGISLDDPKLTPPERCRYDAGVEVIAAYIPSAGAFLTLVPGGTYAVLAFEGSAREIGGAWHRLLEEWLPGSGFDLDGRPCFEYYAPDAASGADRFRCDLLIPVGPSRD